MAQVFAVQVSFV